MYVQSYRGRKPSGPVGSLSSGNGTVPSETNGSTVVPASQQPPTRPSPQPPTVHMLKPDQQAIPVQQQPMVSTINCIHTSVESSAHLQNFPKQIDIPKKIRKENHPENINI